MKNEIANQHREFCDCTDRGKCFGCVTADEIERLQAEARQMEKELDKLRALNNGL